MMAYDLGYALGKQAKVGDEPTPRAEAFEIDQPGLELPQPRPQLQPGYVDITSWLPRQLGTTPPRLSDIELMTGLKPEKRPELPAPFNIFKAGAKIFEPALIHLMSGKYVGYMQNAAATRGWQFDRYGLRTDKGLVTDANRIFEMLEFPMPEHVQSAVNRWRKFSKKLLKRIA